MPPSSRTTVVVTTHNYGRYLDDAVTSAVQQTVAPQVLIMDDGSTDDTGARLEALSGRYPTIRVRRSARAQGPAATRNEAVRLVDTEWLIYLDADDWLDARFVERGEAWIDRYGPVDVLTTDMVVVREGERPFRRRARPPRTWRDLARRNGIVQTSFIRRDMVTALGGYDPQLEFEDWDFWIRAMKAGYRIARLPGPHLYRREHGLNRSKTCDEAAATRQIQDRHFASDPPATSTAGRFRIRHWWGRR